MGRINSIQGFAGHTSIVASSLEPEYIGSTMVFAQPASPPGWVKITTHNDYALRVVSGTGGVATTSNQPFSTVMSTSSTMYSPETGSWPVSTDVTTVSELQMGTHSHTMSASSGAGLSGYTSGWPGSGPGSTFTGVVNPVTAYATGFYGGYSGGGGGHSHTSGTVTAITYDSPFNLNIKYKDVLLAKYH